MRPKEVVEPARKSLLARPSAVTGRSWRGGSILAKDLATKLDAAVTDEDTRTGDKLPDLVLTLTAKAAARGAAPTGYAESIDGVL